MMGMALGNGKGPGVINFTLDFSKLHLKHLTKDETAAV